VEVLFVLLGLPSQTFYYLIFALFPAIAIPIVMGAKYGPLVGFMVGFGGKLLADGIIYGVIWIWWPIGFGLMGFIPGLNFHKYYKGKYAEGGNLFRLSMYALLAAFVCATIPSILSIFVDQLGFYFPILSYFLPMFLIAACNGVIIAPILARGLEYFDSRYSPAGTGEITSSTTPTNITQIGAVIISFCFLLGFGLFILTNASPDQMMAGCAGSVPFGHETLGSLQIALDLGMYALIGIGITLSVVLLIHWIITHQKK